MRDSVTTSRTADALITGDFPVITGSGTLATGQNLTRGALLGKITLGAASSAAKSGGNTGGGTLTLDATTPILANAKAGLYKVRCIAAATNSGTFIVTDPDGYSLGQVVVGATFETQIKFVLADSGTDFAVGDGFDVTIAAGSGQLRLIDKAGVDGRQYPYAVLADDINASSGAEVCPLYLTGSFASGEISFTSGTVAADVLAACRDIGIHLVSISANN